MEEQGVDAGGTRQVERDPRDLIRLFNALEWVATAASTRPNYSWQFTTDNYSKTECQCRKPIQSAVPPDLVYTPIPVTSDVENQHDYSHGEG